jgi:tripartite-type tricarboxylate transporter receptor subunit TctC
MKLKTLVFSALIALVPLLAQAQTEWKPTRPVTAVVPFAPGGATDVLARNFQKYVEKRGITMVIENRGGAEGLIGMRHGAGNAPDGYTLVFGTIGTLAQKGPDGWDPLANLQVLTGLRGSVYFLVTNPKSGITSADDLVARLKDPSVRINGGSGSPTHRAVMEFFVKAHRIDDAVIINYRGAGPAVQDLLSNQIQWIFLPGSVVSAQVESGALRLLATDRRRGERNLVPGSTSVFDAKINEYSRIDGHNVSLPNGAPSNVVNYWSNLLRDFLNDPATKEDMDKDFSLSVPFGPRDVEDKVQTWRRTVPPPARN